MEKGLENVFKRYNRLARVTRAALQAFGLSMIAPDNPADSTRSICSQWRGWRQASQKPA
jgi:aspartate aminotransferase-like enzyme